MKNVYIRRPRQTKVAKIITFSMGFRSYVRDFWGAILRLLRPSLPLCFPIRGLPFEAAAALWVSDARGSAPGVFPSGGCLLNRKHMGFRSYVRDFWGTILRLFF